MGRCLRPHRARDHPGVNPTLVPDIADPVAGEPCTITQLLAITGIFSPVVFALKGEFARVLPSQGQDLISPLLLPG